MMTKNELQTLIDLSNKFKFECFTREKTRYQGSELYNSVDILNKAVSHKLDEIKRNQIPPTEKQVNFIKEIESSLKIKFEGETKQEAWQFIQDNIKRYNERQSDLWFTEEQRNYKPSKQEIEREKWLEEDRKKRAEDGLYDISLGADGDPPELEPWAPGM